MKKINTTTIVARNLDYQYGNKGPVGKWFDLNWEQEWDHNFIEQECLHGLTPKEVDRESIQLIQAEIFKHLDIEISFAERNIPEAGMPPANMAFFYFKETFGRRFTKEMKQEWYKKLDHLQELLQANRKAQQ